MLRFVATFLPFLLLPCFCSGDEFEREPILYSQGTPDNCISRLQQRLDAGDLSLRYDDEKSYLPALLKELGVPVESQMLVFSKTSLQLRRISPRTPRAIYFNDEVYVGFCQAGDVLEISAVDARLGTVFYTLDQQEKPRPQFERRTDNCLVCHSSSRTEGIPGHLVRSLYVDTSGQPLLSAGSRMVDHTTPIEHRWGGWYVTGLHGTQKHLGNLIIRGRDVEEPVDNSAGQNVRELKGRFNTEQYLTPHSDIVALMVLEHQALVHNRIVKASFDTRQALDYNEMMNRTLENKEGTLLESTTRRIRSTGDRLVEALLMVNEAKLTESVKGTSGFTEAFAKSGPQDPQGRSLRDLDLNTRLFKYPCSYLIYSEAFDGLPIESRDYIWQRLHDVLSGADQSEKFAHLSPDDRQAILEILRATKANLPEYFTGTSG
ncbi:MAG: hypothetical protein KDB01_10050 [Planctomycetaceae bacterium]|nr:hypothetical protein [Planctomycetaceae bacterium]